jgi:hypothetical protein
MSVSTTRTTTGCCDGGTGGCSSGHSRDESAVVASILTAFRIMGTSMRLTQCQSLRLRGGRLRLWFAANRRLRRGSRPSCSVRGGRIRLLHRYVRGRFARSLVAARSLIVRLLRTFAPRLLVGPFPAATHAIEAIETPDHFQNVDRV